MRSHFKRRASLWNHTDGWIYSFVNRSWNVRWNYPRALSCFRSTGGKIFSSFPLEKFMKDEPTIRNANAMFQWAVILVGLDEPFRERPPRSRCNWPISFENRRSIIRISMTRDLTMEFEPDIENGYRKFLQIFATNDIENFVKSRESCVLNVRTLVRCNRHCDFFFIGQ